jgi:hypothetical protein
LLLPVSRLEPPLQVQSSEPLLQMEPVFQAVAIGYGDHVCDFLLVPWSLAPLEGQSP